MTAKVLVVEDEEALSLVLRYNLEAEGFSVVTVQRGDDAELAVAESLFDLIILDWMLPGLSGLELCRRLRTGKIARNVPIILLTARGEEADRIRGLTTGADDYVVKPFSLPELMARVKAILRRSNPDRIADVLDVGDIQLDREAHRVTRAGREVRLGPTEYRLLEFLMEAPGRVFFARTASGRRLGARCICRRTHGGCACGAFTQSDQSRARKRPYPHGSRLGLCVRRAHHQHCHELRRQRTAGGEAALPQPFLQQLDGISSRYGSAGCRRR